MSANSITEADVRAAAELFDADLAARGVATFTPEQIAAFKAVSDEPDVLERARKCQELGAKILRDAEESMKRYEDVRQQAAEFGLDLDAQLDGDAQRARERAAAEYLDRAKSEVAAEARRLFGSAAGGDESAAAVMSRGFGRMRV